MAQRRRFSAEFKREAVDLTVARRNRPAKWHDLGGSAAMFDSIERFRNPGMKQRLDTEHQQFWSSPNCS